jgi:myo-inositol-1(or 4)-monophosphatase
MTNELDRRLDVARAIGSEAAEMARGYFARAGTLSVAHKGPQDIVTEADGAVERMIRARLAASFPDDSFLGEEDGGAAGTRIWVVDPIDGTSNFARGLPHFCVSIAFVDTGTTEIGVIDEPVARRQYWTRRGTGAFCDGRPLRVRDTTDPGRAMVEVSFSRRHPVGDYSATVLRFLEAGYDVRQAGSAALGLAQVADGRLDGYFERHLYSWDVLAGALLVREAGGRTNEFLTGTAMTDGGEMLASVPGLWVSMARLCGSRTIV